MTRDAANDADGRSEMERVLTTLAAMVEGDRALNIDGAAPVFRQAFQQHPGGVEVACARR